jgi:protoporphyrinogen oxidase
VHDKDAEITAEIKQLLGDKLSKINVPSQIYHNGKLIDFPLSPLDLMLKLGLFPFVKAGLEVLRARLNTAGGEENFEHFAVKTYGRDIAESFLLNYSEKLWGLPCDRLSVNIAGKRLKGLDLKTFLVEAMLGEKAKISHLEGAAFYYPAGGIGTIPASIVQFCGEQGLRRGARITGIMTAENRIQTIQINGVESIDVNDHEVVSTLPLNFFLEVMQPRPPAEILQLARRLRFRNLVLVAFFLNKKSITRNATVYFPAVEFPFTRLYEPKNRDLRMSPAGKTSLLAEIPCQPEDDLWKHEDSKLIEIIRTHLEQIGWIGREEILGAAVHRLEHAYPILESGFEEKVRQINGFLRTFRNLKLSGRNGRFMYSWVHDMLRFGKDITDEYSSSQ